MGIGQRIKRTTAEKGMTLKELSEKSGVSYNTIYSITKRDSERIQGSILQRISSALGVSPSDLIDSSPGINDIIRLIVDDHPKATFSTNKDTGIVSLTLGERSKRVRKSRLLQHFDSLNDEGQQKAVERVEELSEILRYRRPESPPLTPT